MPLLTERLKRTPAVAGVAVRESMLASFYQTIARSMTATNSVLIGFAFLVALAAAVFSGIMVAGRIRTLDQVAVLKTRE